MCNVKRHRRRQSPCSPATCRIYASVLGMDSRKRAFHRGCAKLHGAGALRTSSQKHFPLYTTVTHFCTLHLHLRFWRWLHALATSIFVFGDSYTPGTVAHVGHAVRILPSSPLRVHHPAHRKFAGRGAFEHSTLHGHGLRRGLPLAKPEFSFGLAFEPSTHTISAKGHVSQTLPGQARDVSRTREQTYALLYVNICLLWHMCLLKQDPSESYACLCILLSLLRQGESYPSKNPPAKQFTITAPKTGSQRQSNASVTVVLHNHTCKQQMYLYHTYCSIHTTADM